MNRVIEDQQEVAEWVREQTGELEIAVAFWGAGAVEELGLAKRKKPFRVLLDLSAGASNPAEIRKLLKIKKASVLHLERLHAKAWITDHEVLIGSANASANGLGIEGAESIKWNELGLLTDDTGVVKDAKKWFDAKWRQGAEITDEVLDEVKKRWQVRQFSSPGPLKPRGGILAAALKSPESFEGTRIWVVVNAKVLSDRAKDQVKGLKTLMGGDVEAWEDWPSMPSDVLLISFMAEKGKPVEIDMPTVYDTSRAAVYDVLTLVPPSKIPGYRIDALSKWKPLLEQARYDEEWDEEDGICLPLAEFVKRYAVR